MPCAVEMEIDTLENTSGTKYTVSESTILQTAIVTKDHGMKAKGKGTVHILSETAKQNAANGMLGTSSILSRH